VEAVEKQGTLFPADPRTLAERDAGRADVLAIRTRWVVYAGAAIYAAVFVCGAVFHYLAYEQARFDLGNMVQAVWSTSHGDFLNVTTLTGYQASRLGAHVDPFLALLAPFWWAWSSPVMLLVVQALGVATGALPVYWLARKHLQSERAAAHFAFAYLLFPATQFNAFALGTGFHSVSLAVPLILFAIWFLDEERLLPFAVFALLAASTKEEIPAAVGCLGIWYAIRKGRRLVGAVIFASGTIVFLVNFLVIIPHFSRSGVAPFAGRYKQVGGTPRGVIHTALTDPIAFVHAAATWHKLIFLVLLLVPFLGLWLLEPLLLLGAIPDLAIDLLSSKPEQSTIQFHYTAGIIPFVLAASIFGAARLKRNPDRTSFYALAGAASIALYSPIYFAGHDLRLTLSSNPTSEAKAHALGLIPSNVPVAASNQLAGYLSARKRILVFPYLRESSWVIVDKNDRTYGDFAGYRRAVARIDHDGHWGLVYSANGIEVLRRR
jgi:uncharacterized membrane protein